MSLTNDGSGELRSTTGLADLINAATINSSSGALTESSLREMVESQLNYQSLQRDIPGDYFEHLQQRMNTFPPMYPQEYLGQTTAPLEETPKKPEKKTELNQVELLKISEKINQKKKSEHDSQIKTTEDSLNAKKSLLENTSVEIEGLEKKLEKEKKEFQEKSFEKEFEKIKALEKISDIYLLGKDIVFETTDLCVVDFYMDCNKTFKKKTKKEQHLGKFAIRINQDFNKMSVTNLSYESSYDLPTIKTGACCWGNIQQDIKDDLNKHNILEFIQDMLGYLETPENQGAYIRWDKYFEGRKEQKREPRAICQDITTYSSAAYDYASSYINATTIGTVAIADGSTWMFNDQPMIQTRHDLEMPRNFERFFRMFSHSRNESQILNYLTLDGQTYVTAWMRSVDRELEGRELFFDIRNDRREIRLLFDYRGDISLSIHLFMIGSPEAFRRTMTEIRNTFQQYNMNRRASMGAGGFGGSNGYGGGGSYGY